MTPAIAALLMQTAGQAVGQGMGLGIGEINNRRNLTQQRKLQNMQIGGQKDLTTFNQAAAFKMWQDTNYSAQMKELEKAGLNPALLYGMSGGGGTTAQITQGNVSGGHVPQPHGGVDMSSMMQLGLMKAQKENIEADTANKKAETGVKGATIPNIQADTENKILNAIILKYTGKEVKDTYEQVTSPVRGVQAKTHQDELEARQGVATTIYEMWTEGKLKEKSIGEVTQILLNNAKTEQETKQITESMKLLEENIKGAKIDNIIRDLEAKLQTETGIDKNAPTLIKLLGRLFVNLMRR